jgi:hypothetical protein
LIIRFFPEGEPRAVTDAEVAKGATAVLSCDWVTMDAEGMATVEAACSVNGVVMD